MLFAFFSYVISFVANILNFRESLQEMMRNFFQNQVSAPV
jgi:hypothetical protein